MNSIISLLGFLFICFIVILLFIQPTTPSKLYTSTLKPWPPQIGVAYPDISLIDQDGRKFQLSDYRGKVVLLHLVGMNSPISQAFSGSKTFGAYKNAQVIDQLESISTLIKKYGKGLEFPNPDLIYIEVLCYGINFEKPVPKDAIEWAKHFNLKTTNKQFVVVAQADLRSKLTYGMIPGFQLLDKNLVLQGDSTGPNPQDNLFKTLIPMVPIAINAKKR